ncbi:hypothetical protein I79_003827 [Cricetulus griseus]|uniref:Uncharacterized protein n=1 Tax=Cricetulus griseus TaxID=10029 RepID=G3H107_CRIGR|nr:hypothetical protein I79_003827 [Cricetulus griseus]
MNSVLKDGSYHSRSHPQQSTTTKVKFRQAMVGHAVSPSTQEAEAGGSPEFEISLVYKS